MPLLRPWVVGPSLVSKLFTRRATIAGIIPWFTIIITCPGCRAYLIIVTWSENCKRRELNALGRRNSPHKKFSLLFQDISGIEWEDRILQCSVTTRKHCPFLLGLRNSANSLAWMKWKSSKSSVCNLVNDSESFYSSKTYDIIHPRSVRIHDPSGRDRHHLARWGRVLRGWRKTLLFKSLIVKI